MDRAFAGSVLCWRSLGLLDANIDDFKTATDQTPTERELEQALETILDALVQRNVLETRNEPETQYRYCINESDDI